MIAERAKNEKELEVALAKIQKQLEESQSQSAELLQVDIYIFTARFNFYDNMYIYFIFNLT